MQGRDIPREIVGVEEGLFFLAIASVGRSSIGRARNAHGRKVELAQFALPRRQTTSDKKQLAQKIHRQGSRIN